MSKVKAKTALDEVDKDGNFVRTEAGFRNKIEAGGKFPPEKDRYHLYIALACPWACGTYTALKWKGLDKIVSVSIVHPTWGRTRPDDEEDKHSGWHFAAPGDPPRSNSLGHGEFECDDALIPDILNGAKSIRDLYELANDTTGKYTTPVLWDKKEKMIVCNESLIILDSFNSSFQNLCEHPERDLFPKDQRAEADALNEWIYPNINDGVYRAGFAVSQAAYEKAVDVLFQSLERMEKRLAESNTKFLTGDSFTWIDLRLYHTLVRFDPVYITYFKTNKKRIADYPHMLKFIRECYKVQAVKETTNIKHIKMHYFTSHPYLNTYGIIPAYNGPDLEA